MVFTRSPRQLFNPFKSLIYAAAVMSENDGNSHGVIC